MGGLPPYSVCVSVNYFLRVFPGFIARPFRGVGVGFGSRIFDSWSRKGNRDFPESPVFLHMGLIRVRSCFSMALEGRYIP